MPTTTRSSVPLGTVSTGKPFDSDRCPPKGTITAAETTPTTNAMLPTTSALATRTRPRRGLAARVTPIRPRRYSTVM